MQYLSAAEAAKKWKISERSVRNYCAKGRVEGAVLKANAVSFGSRSGKKMENFRAQRSQLLC